MKLTKFKPELSSNNLGFTLIELIVVIILIGILVTISVPSFLGMVNRNRIDNALVTLQGTLKESQREAIKKSKTCQVTLPEKNTANAILQGTCLVTGQRTLDNVYITYNNTTNLKFTYQGEVSPMRTIIIYIPNVNYRRCLVISNGIGMMRTGVYRNSNLDSLDGNEYCKSN